MFGDMGGGINVSFGLGGFPFMGGPMFQMGNIPAGQQFQRRRPGGGGVANRRQREEQQRLARIFVTIAILVIILVIFS
jgi:hypothetical protein